MRYNTSENKLFHNKRVEIPKVNILENPWAASDAEESHFCFTGRKLI